MIYLLLLLPLPYIIFVCFDILFLTILTPSKRTKLLVTCALHPFRTFYRCLLLIDGIKRGLIK